jgi:hypothetical protein
VIAERLHESICTTQFLRMGLALPMTASLGFCVIDDLQSGKWVFRDDERCV